MADTSQPTPPSDMHVTNPLPTDANHPAHAVHVLANREGLAACLTLTVQVCTDLALADDDMQAVRLAVEEACTNVVDHGYAGQAAGPLSLVFRLTAADMLEAQIRDQATPFHPDQARPPDLLSDLDDRPIGGLGWYFIKQVMTEVDYTSSPDGNCLYLRRRLSAKPGTPEAGTT